MILFFILFLRMFVHDFMLTALGAFSDRSFNSMFDLEMLHSHLLPSLVMLSFFIVNWSEPFTSKFLFTAAWNHYPCWPLGCRWIRYQIHIPRFPSGPTLSNNTFFILILSAKRRCSYLWISACFGLYPSWLTFSLWFQTLKHCR